MVIKHKKNTAYPLIFPMVDSATPSSFKTGLSPTDTALSKDGGGDWTPLAITDIAEDVGYSVGAYKMNLAASELNHDYVAIKFSAAGAADTFIIFDMSTHDIDDIVDENNRIDVGRWLGSAVTLSTANKPDVNVDEISDDTTAPGNLELMFDGTGYAGGTAKLNINVAAQDNIDFSALQKASLNAATPASIVGNVGGNVVGSVGSVASFGTLISDIWHQLLTAITTVGSIGRLIKDYLDTTISSRSPEAGGNIVSIKAKTDSLAFTTGNVHSHIKVQDNIDFSALQKTSLNAATPASVVGAVGSVTGNVGGNVNGNVAGSIGLLAVQAKADVQAECEDAIVAKHLDHLITRQGTAQAGGVNMITLDAGASAADNLYNGQAVLVVGGTGAGQARKIESYNGTTKVVTVDSNWSIQPVSGSEFIILDIYVLSGTGATAQQVWEYATRLLTAAANITSDGATIDQAKIANLDAVVSSRAAAAVCTETRLAELDAANLPADIVAVKADTAAIKVVTDKLGTTVELDGVAYRFTTNALEQAPTGGGMTLTQTVEGTITVGDSFRLFLSVLTGKASGGGTATLTFRDMADVKNRLVITQDSKGNRTAILTRDGT